MLFRSEAFEVQEGDENRDFHNQYMEFMQQNHQLDDFIERKAAKRKKKQPSLDEFLQVDEDDSDK